MTTTFPTTIRGNDEGEEGEAVADTVTGYKGDHLTGPSCSE